MFLKQEKPEMDDFEEEKTLVLKEKVFTRYPCKNVKNIFAYSFV